MTKAIILAAGVGRRLKGVAGDIPKCLINVDGEPIISRQIRLLKMHGISEIAVVVGYKKEKIKEILDNQVVYFENPSFETTNSVVSLWYAKDFLRDDDIIVLNADVVFDPSILKDLIQNDEQMCDVVEIGKYNPLGYKVRIKNNLVDLTSMDIPKEEVAGEYAGMNKVSKEILPLLVEVLDDFMKRKDTNTWYETAFVEMIRRGARMAFIDTAGRPWIEIDTLDDVKLAEKYFGDVKYGK